MLLYWAMFTVGFCFGAILAFIIFAPRKPEDEEIINRQYNLKTGVPDERPEALNKEFIQST